MRPNISDRNIDRLKRYANEKIEKTQYGVSWPAKLKDTKGYTAADGVTVDDVLDQLLSEAGF